jgi:hypothetical protein
MTSVAKNGATPLNKRNRIFWKKQAAIAEKLEADEAILAVTGNLIRSAPISWNKALSVAAGAGEVFAKSFSKRRPSFKGR